MREKPYCHCRILSYCCWAQCFLHVQYKWFTLTLSFILDGRSNFPCWRFSMFSAAIHVFFFFRRLHVAIELLTPFFQLKCRNFNYYCLTADTFLEQLGVWFRLLHKSDGKHTWSLPYTLAFLPYSTKYKVQSTKPHLSLIVLHASCSLECNCN